MIRGGIAVDRVEGYLVRRAWLRDAADLLCRPAVELATELVDTMRRGGAVIEREGRLRAAADHSAVDPGALDQPCPRAWPPSAHRVAKEGSAP
jgi:hypothetical protein